MKLRLLAVIAALAMLAGIAPAQDIVSPGLTYTWTAVTGTSGQLGKYINMSGTTQQRPGNYTIDITTTGTTPAACTFRVEGSSDAVSWYGLDVTSPATTSCTTSFMESIAQRPVQYIRINLTYTQGDATTIVIFHFTGEKK